MRYIKLFVIAVLLSSTCAYAVMTSCPNPSTTTTVAECPTCEPCEECEECDECPTCPNCPTCPSTRCPDVIVPPCPSCICEAPVIPSCPECTLTCPDPCQEIPDVDMSGTWDMVGLMAATGIVDTDSVWGTITINSKDGKLGWGYQCLVRNVFDLKGVGCMTYLLRKR